MSWKKTTKEKPKMTKTNSSGNDTWWNSDYVVGCYEDNLHHGKGEQVRYDIMRYETGKGWRSWYSPAIDDHVPAPDKWCEIPEE